MIGEAEKRILMKLQYEFPLTPTPYRDAAEDLGVQPSELLSTLRRLSAAGVLKRIGFYYNPRSRGVGAALAALATRDPARASDELSRRLTLTHSYVRDHPVYKLWVVARYRALDELLTALEEACRATGCTDYLVLPATRLHRLSVKYDLHLGVSRAGPYSRVSLNPPSPEELGVPPRLPELVRRLPLEEHPYARAAEELGVSEEEVVEHVHRLLRAGVLGDPGATLNGGRIGFTVNAMYVAEPVPGADACSWVADNIPYATHVVSRTVMPGDAYWSYTCFFMVHATSTAKLRVVDEELSRAPVTRWDRLLSLTDLKPGAQR